jgi:dipeptide/tripeptide permease
MKQQVTDIQKDLGIIWEPKCERFNFYGMRVILNVVLVNLC